MNWVVRPAAIHSHLGHQGCRTQYHGSPHVVAKDIASHVLAHLLQVPLHIAAILRLPEVGDVLDILAAGGAENSRGSYYISVSEEGNITAYLYQRRDILLHICFRGGTYYCISFSEEGHITAYLFLRMDILLHICFRGGTYYCISVSEDGHITAYLFQRRDILLHICF